MLHQVSQIVPEESEGLDNAGGRGCQVGAVHKQRQGGRDGWAAQGEVPLL